ncbi:MAG: ASCH domain-containing protein [Bacilli bacterium]|nr:ASCH domain-containing protein [Bacilli bacterium]
MERWMFGEKSDELLNKVINKSKTATSSLYNNEKSKVGEKSIIMNSLKQDKCLIEIVDYKILSFKDMTEDLVVLEGEGNLETWQSIHKRFFSNRLGITEDCFNEKTKILFEIFKVIKVFNNNFMTKNIPKKLVNEVTRK